MRPPWNPHNPPRDHTLIVYPSAPEARAAAWLFHAKTRMGLDSVQSYWCRWPKREVPHEDEAAWWSRPSTWDRGLEQYHRDHPDMGVQMVVSFDAGSADATEWETLNRGANALGVITSAPASFANVYLFATEADAWLVLEDICRSRDCPWGPGGSPLFGRLRVYPGAL